MELPDLIIFLLISSSIWAIVFAVKKGSVWKYIAGAVFTTYLFCIASVTIFPIQFDSTIRKMFQENGWRITDCIVLIPFHDGISKDDLLNVIMTIPFGFLLPFVKKKVTWRGALIAGAVLGTIIELIQLVLAAIQGFSFRYVDVADVICNTVGTMIGWLIAAAFICFVQKRKPSDSNEKSLYSYITQRRVK
jgi:glycopeptide antibiotics resistance protein